MCGPSQLSFQGAQRRHGVGRPSPKALLPKRLGVPVFTRSLCPLRAGGGNPADTREGPCCRSAATLRTDASGDRPVRCPRRGCRTLRPAGVQSAPSSCSGDISSVFLTPAWVSAYGAGTRGSHGLMSRLRYCTGQSPLLGPQAPFCAEAQAPVRARCSDSDCVAQAQLGARLCCLLSLGSPHPKRDSRRGRGEPGEEARTRKRREKASSRHARKGARAPGRGLRGWLLRSGPECPPWGGWT